MKYIGHLLLQEQELPSGTEWTPADGCWRVLLAAEGAGYWLEKAGAREISSGAVLLVPPHHDGELRASQLGPLKLRFFQFCPELLSGLLSMAERLAFEQLTAGKDRGFHLLAPDHPAAARLSEICSRQRKSGGFHLRSLLLEVIGLAFGEELAQPVQKDALALSARKRLKTLLDHLTEDEFLTASIDDLAAYCGCSARHFGRLFRRNFGVSVRGRQAGLRLLKARRLLEQTDACMMTIAQACGYPRLAVFNTQFKKSTGLSPSEFRRQAGGTCSPVAPTPPAPAARNGGAPSPPAPLVTEK